LEKEKKVSKKSENCQKMPKICNFSLNFQGAPGAAPEPPMIQKMIKTSSKHIFRKSQEVSAWFYIIKYFTGTIFIKVGQNPPPPLTNRVNS